MLMTFVSKVMTSLGRSLHTGSAAVHAGVLPCAASRTAHHAGGGPAAAGRHPC
jgi:hypothetical protein